MGYSSGCLECEDGAESRMICGDVDQLVVKICAFAEPRRDWIHALHRELSQSSKEGPRVVKPISIFTARQLAW